MDSKDFIEHNPPQQTIPEYLNCKLFCHKDYIESSLMFICLAKGKNIYIDKLCIGKSLSKKDEALVEKIMSDIVKDNSSVLEEAYHISLSSSFFLSKEVMNDLAIRTKDS